MGKFLEILKRDLRLAFHQGTDSVTVVAFFTLTVALFPLGLGPDQEILKEASPAIIWVAALLASILSLNRMFETDYEDGSLELLCVQPITLEVAVIAKILGHWLTTAFPLIVISPILGLFLNIPWDGYLGLVASLTLGTPCLSLIGSVGAALVLGARRGTSLLALLILPLYIPVLIFGVSAVNALIQGNSPQPHFFIIGGILLGGLALAPLATAAALRQAVE